MNNICGRTTEVAITDHTVNVYRCEREPSHGGTVHAGHNLSGERGFVTWPSGGVMAAAESR
jgi:hypothetical protein